VRVRELGRFIRDQRASARLSLRKLSKLAGISNPYLSQIERGLRRPSAEILQAIAKALRISAETLYIKAGILEERDDVIDMAATIRRDPTLNANQKQILQDLYNSSHGRPSRSKAKRPTVRKVAAAKRPASRKTSKTSKPSSRPAARAKSRKAPAGRRTRRAG